MNVYNVGVMDPFKMDCVLMHKWVKETYKPLMTWASCGFKTKFKDSPCSTEWIDVSW